MGDFGHFSATGAGFHVDGWGAGPFFIEANGKRYRFEDSDQFGPALVDRRGDPIKNPWPNETSPFWPAHTAWVKGGRKLADDGVTCVYTLPRPTVVRIKGRQIIVISEGDEDGGYVTEAGRILKFAGDA